MHVGKFLMNPYQEMDDKLYVHVYVYVFVYAYAYAYANVHVHVPLGDGRDLLMFCRDTSYR